MFDFLLVTIAQFTDQCLVQTSIFGVCLQCSRFLSKWLCFQVTGMIIYIHPLIKSISLSLLPHLLDYTGVPMVLFPNIKLGDIIDDAVVTSADKSRGVHLQKDGLTFFAHVSRIVVLTKKKIIT